MGNSIKVNMNYISYKIFNHINIIIGKKATRRLEENRDQSYLFQFKFQEKLYCIDGLDGTFKGRNINHSRKHPNAKPYPEIHDGFYIFC